MQVVVGNGWSLLVALVKLEPESSSSQGHLLFLLLSLFFLFLILMSSGCYSLLYNNVLVGNGKN